MLPFLKPKSQTGIIVQQHRKPDSAEPKEPDSDGQNHALEAAAEDILRAINSKDAAHLALALQAAHDICASAESDDEDEDFDAQNEKAAHSREGE